MSFNILKSRIDAEVFDNLFKLNNLLTDLNNCIKPRSFFLFFEVEEFKNLLNINKSNKIKTKKKFKKSQNKKKTITKVEKKTINFTKRDFFNFEYVERKFAIKIKRIKKKIVNKFKKKTNKKTIEV